MKLKKTKSDGGVFTAGLVVGFIVGLISSALLVGVAAYDYGVAIEKHRWELLIIDKPDVVKKIKNRVAAERAEARALENR